jgi:hypothetical protein
MTEKIKDKKALRHWFSRQIESIDESCYVIEFDELVDNGTENFEDVLFGLGWEYGRKVPEEITTEWIFNCIEAFEK